MFIFLILIETFLCGLASPNILQEFILKISICREMPIYRYEMALTRRYVCIY